MHFIDLTHALRDGQQAFPGDPVLGISPHATIAENRCNVSRIYMGSHQGTHLDALYHFIPDGLTIEKMPLEWFYGPARVLRIPKQAREEIAVADLKPFEALLVPGARIIYETGWHRRYGQPDFFTDFPSLTQEAAAYVADRGIRLLGMDTPTPGRDYYEVHHLLQQRPAEIVIVESLANLDQVPDEFVFAGFPLKWEGGDGSPIRAVAIVA
ncbi:MAG: cyclase family protein [Candidatus Methylacidiphilales bacterium]|nr:cyclase family protein [Candidatus Methylacidiphilales bacterium]